MRVMECIRCSPNSAIAWLFLVRLVFCVRWSNDIGDEAGPFAIGSSVGIKAHIIKALEERLLHTTLAPKHYARYRT